MSITKNHKSSDTRIQPNRDTKKKIRILYIEDDKQLRELAARLLENRGYSVITRENTDKANAMVSIWEPDIIITDNDLGPGQEQGIDLAVRLKKKGLNVAVMSGNSDIMPIASSWNIPFFLKPCYIMDAVNHFEEKR